MLLHGNARLTPFQRSLLCVRVREEGWTVAEAAEAAGCAERTAYRWLARHDAGEAMLDRSSAPKTCPTGRRRRSKPSSSVFDVCVGPAPRSRRRSRWRSRRCVWC
jgi:hypothetical protein